MANYPLDDDDIPLDPSTLIRLGTISAVQLNPPRCKVLYGDPDADDGDIGTPWVRWLMLRAGKMRKGSAPSLGEEVLLLCPDGQVGNGVALCGLPNDNFPLALHTLEEDVTEYDDGARIGYDPESHTLTATLPDGATATIKAPGGITLDGPVHITGKLTADDDVVTGGISLKSHLHPNITRGAALSDPPQAG
jgi:phage baseplate assembly protein V